MTAPEFAQGARTSRQAVARGVGSWLEVARSTCPFQLRRSPTRGRAATVASEASSMLELGTPALGRWRVFAAVQD